MRNPNRKIYTPRLTESLDEYLKRHGVENFSARELLTARKVGVTSPPPKQSWWPRIIPAARLAQAMRARMGHPLVIGNGYRPPEVNRRAGGARRSQHLYFRAVDIDLPRGHKSRTNQEKFYRQAAELFLEFGDDMEIGLGLYRKWRGTRVHFDCGYRKRYWNKHLTKPLLDMVEEMRTERAQVLR